MLDLDFLLVVLYALPDEEDCLLLLLDTLTISTCFYIATCIMKIEKLDSPIFSFMK